MMEDGGGHTEQVQILHGVDTADVEYRYCDLCIIYLHSYFFRIGVESRKSYKSPVKHLYNFIHILKLSILKILELGTEAIPPGGG